MKNLVHILYLTVALTVAFASASVAQMAAPLGNNGSSTTVPTPGTVLGTKTGTIAIKRGTQTAAPVASATPTTAVAPTAPSTPALYPTQTQQQYLQGTTTPEQALQQQFFPGTVTQQPLLQQQYLQGTATQQPALPGYASPQSAFSATSATTPQQVILPNSGPSLTTTRLGTTMGTRSGTVAIRPGTEIGSQVVFSGQAQQQYLQGGAPQRPVLAGPAGLEAAFSHALFGQPTIRNQAVTPPQSPLSLPFSNIVGPSQRSTTSNTQRSGTFLNVPVGNANR